MAEWNPSRVDVSLLAQELSLWLGSLCFCTTTTTTTTATTTTTTTTTAAAAAAANTSNDNNTRVRVPFVCFRTPALQVSGLHLSAARNII